MTVRELADKLTSLCNEQGLANATVEIKEHRGLDGYFELLQSAGIVEKHKVQLSVRDDV